MINKFFNHQPPIKLKFRRFEFKYCLPDFLADKIITDLLNYMDWDPYAFSQDSNSYQVSSLYFDTANFGCYYEKMAGVKDRKKLRLRTYATEFNSKTPVFLEIKRKSDMVIFKDRLVSNYENCSEFITTGQFNLTKKEASLQDRELLKEFLWLKNYNCLMPKIMVIYKRKPLIGRLDPRFRVTFDSQIKVYPANQLFFSEQAVEVFPKVVMELKYNNNIPAWFHQIVQKYQLNREPFSKYCESLETCQKHYQYV